MKATSRTPGDGHLLIPDIHGHLPRLQAALTVARRFPEAHLIFLGDLIDDSPRRRTARRDYRERGVADDSREVLKLVRELQQQGTASVLLGNHEVLACSAVLDGDWGMQEIWWRNGGRETAASYGWRGHGEPGVLAADLQWLREHGRLWLEVGPEGRKVLAAHATRPHLTRVEEALNRPEHLLPAEDFDPVVWYPLGEDQQPPFLHPLPTGFQASVHGHMEAAKVRELLGPDQRPAIQLDLHPGRGKVAVLHLSPAGERQVILQGIG
ncbi:hypothetical protein D3875_03515 [Deinococcus cavernae]|uniref:Calcineurin-like phosphoesterase domain-containing protein n=1 Tax=Deinococcus cavernae TaxID=2320857 RepID=A0A418VET4_9DEIO|nr:metallophosphoesterase [Deinococcus cavernae]RJF74622.1 hypothetical protein D3875_03515 [Deinococcus cavernae]